MDRFMVTPRTRSGLVLQLPAKSLMLYL